LLGCGLVVDRDLNAAYNILKRCAVGHREINACGVVPSGITLKQEALTLIGVGVGH
jgi:transposase